jgi:hypothetical protein
MTQLKVCYPQSKEKEMKKFLVLLLVLVSLAVAKPLPENAVKSVHTLYKFVSLSTDSIKCSGTAVGKHALLMATHCEIKQDNKFLALDGTVVEIEERIRDGADHTIVILKGIEFKNYARIVINYPFELGENVFIIGNPGNLDRVLRKGYFAATNYKSMVPTRLYALDGYFSDSGSAVFNEKGEIVDMISAILSENTFVSVNGDTVSFDTRGDYVKFMVCNPFRFTPIQMYHIYPKTVKH